MSYKPTNDFRFLDRSLWKDHAVPCTQRVLQQRWVGEAPHFTGRVVEEWRDVPVAKEDAD